MHAHAFVCVCSYACSHVLVREFSYFCVLVRVFACFHKISDLRIRVENCG